MSTPKEKPGADGRRAVQSAASLGHERIKSSRPRSKIHRVLRALTQRSLTRFDAEREVSDHTLNTTVAAIGSRYGIRVDRETIEVPGFGGQPTRCCRYWIAADQRDRALRILRERRQ